MASACLRNPPFSPLGTSPCSFLYTGLPRVSQANPLHVNDVTFFVFRGHSCGQEKGCVAETKKKKKGIQEAPSSSDMGAGLYGEGWRLWRRRTTPSSTQLFTSLSRVLMMLLTCQRFGKTNVTAWSQVHSPSSECS